MNDLLMVNGRYGVKIGNLHAFTRQGAIEKYKMFLQVCYGDLNMGSSIVLAGAENDMINSGFTWDELEQIENEYFKSVAAE